MTEKSGVPAYTPSMAVTEGALRFHFRKGKSPKEVRRLAFDLLHAQQLRDSLTPGERAEVARLVAKAAKANPPD